MFRKMIRSIQMLAFSYFQLVSEFSAYVGIKMLAC